jgi:hypothetical protein
LVIGAVLMVLIAGLSPAPTSAASPLLPPVIPPAGVPAEDEPTTGGDVDDGSFRPDAQAELKTSIVSQWNDLIDGTSTGDRDQLQADVETYAATYGMDALSGSDTEAGEPEITPQQFVNSIDVAAVTPSIVMNVAHSGQINNYRCGPATAYMIMRYKGITTSRYASDRGRALSQGALARSTYLRTDEQGATRFALNVMAPGMNRWRENRTAGFYVQFSASSMPSLNGIMRYSAYHAMPNAIGTVQWYNGGRYNNHGSKTKAIGHWIVGYGYAGSGATGYFADPATTVWSGVAPKFTYSTAGFQLYFVGGHGNGVVY